MVGAIFLSEGDNSILEEAEGILAQEAGRRNEVLRTQRRNPRYWKIEEFERFDAVVIRADFTEVIAEYEKRGINVFVMGEMVDRSMVYENPVPPEVDEAIKAGEDYVDSRVVGEMVNLGIKEMTDLLQTVDSIKFLNAVVDRERAKDKPRTGALRAIMDRMKQIRHED